MRGILSTDRECPGKAVSTDDQFCCISEGNLRLAVQDKDASTRHQQFTGSVPLFCSLSSVNYIANINPVLTCDYTKLWRDMNRYSEPSTDIENYFKESISTKGSNNLPIIYRPL